GLYAACVDLADRSMDIARMDALAVAFLVGAIYAGRRATLESAAGWRSAVACGGLMGLAVLTKQSTLPLALALLLAFAAIRPSHVPAYLAALVLTAAVPLALLTLQSGPWPLFYFWSLPRQHTLSLELVTRFWDDVVGRFTLPLLVAPLYVVSRAMAGER